MRGRGIRLALLLFTGTLAAAVGAACGSGGGGGSPTPAGCDTRWRVNDPAYATDLLATLVPGGSATESNGTLTLTFSGTLPGNLNLDLNVETGVFYAKRALSSDFLASVHLLSYAATATNLAAFVGVTGSPDGYPHGERYWIAQEAAGPILFTSSWYNGTGFYQPASGSVGNPVGGLSFHRQGSTTLLLATCGSESYNGSTGGPGNDLAEVIGLGIANVSTAQVTGSMTVRFGGLTVVDTSGNCFTTGLD